MASDAIAGSVRSPLITVLTKSPQLVMLRKLVRIPRAVFGIVVLVAVLICAIFAEHIARLDPEDMDFGNLLSGMTVAHWLGSDQLGRDTFSRLVYGSQVALSVSVGAIGLGVLIGVPLGLVSVYFRGWVDDLLMRAMDALTVFPSLLIAVALAATLGSSLTTVILAIGIANVPWIARVVRSQGLSVREQDYVAAAIAGGMSNFGVIVKHIFPNTLAPIIVQATLGMGYAVLAEAGLGFIGVGVQPPTPTWGNMLQQAFPLLERQPLMSIVPGLAIFLLVLAFNFIGDALRDILDPRLRGVVH
ncbi:ABC transporter permease [Bradyrhizobium sp. WSM1417]|uniref:ABC transporter permease n=1 Tax=Bradyrhizobium sp. WSM1417 TaxID=754500 RepID=UPI00048957E1|nr:ABC transporter permease [Bradyrhizobium sp. WSM1417]